MCVPRPGFSVTASCPFSPGGSRTENEGTNLRWSLFCLRRSGRRGLKAGDTSSPIGHRTSLRSRPRPSPPFQRRSPRQLSPDLRGLVKAGEACVPSRVDGEWLDDSPKVRPLRAAARSRRSPVLAQVAGSGIGCHSAGLPIAWFVWLRGCLSLEGLEERGALSQPEHWRGLEGFQRGPPPIRQAALYPGSRRGHMLAFRREDIPLRPLCLREMLETPTRTAAGGGG